MLLIDAMLVSFAKSAGIAVPPDLDDFDRNLFPHWTVYTEMQLGRPIGGESQLKNAQVIAAVPDDRIRHVTTAKLESQMVSS